MKIIVETEEEYNKWMAEQATFAATVMKEEVAIGDKEEIMVDEASTMASTEK